MAEPTARARGSQGEALRDHGAAQLIPAAWPGRARRPDVLTAALPCANAVVAIDWTCAPHCPPPPERLHGKAQLMGAKMYTRRSLFIMVAVALLIVIGWRVVNPLVREESIPFEVDSILETASVWTVYRVHYLALDGGNTDLGPFTVQVDERVEVAADDRRDLLAAIRGGVEDADNTVPMLIAVEVPEFVIEARSDDAVVFVLFEFFVNRVSFGRPGSPECSILNTTDRAQSKLLALFE